MSTIFSFLHFFCKGKNYTPFRGECCTRTARNYSSVSIYLIQHKKDNLIIYLNIIGFGCVERTIPILRYLSNFVALLIFYIVKVNKRPANIYSFIKYFRIVL